MSHFDRYASVKPVDTRWGTVASHENSFAQHSKQQLLKDAEIAIAWGMPCSESYGMTNRELINIISRLVKYIKAQ